MKMLGKILLGAAAAALLLSVPAAAWAEAAAVAVGPAAAPAAAAPVVVADVSWWQTLWAQVQAPLVTLAVAVMTALGTILTAKANAYLGSRASEAINSVYMMAVEQAAGWLQSHIAAAAKTSADPAKSFHVMANTATSSLNAAVDYAKKSFPDIMGKLDVGDGELAHDIVGALGKIVAPQLAPALDIFTKILPALPIRKK